MNSNYHKNSEGFSLIELLISITVILILLSSVFGLLSESLRVRGRESQITNRISAAQNSLNLMSREIENAGFGLTNNGIVLSDSDADTLHIRSNIVNSNTSTSDLGEDVTYSFDSTNRRILRYDKFPSPVTTIIANDVTSFTINYLDYTTLSNGNISVSSYSSTPTANTARIKLTMQLATDAVSGLPNQSVNVSTEVAIRNSDFILNRY
jgi:prepilin-type N-terminal cleavage/methylation domain-containing protein